MPPTVRSADDPPAGRFSLRSLTEKVPDAGRRAVEVAAVAVPIGPWIRMMAALRPGSRGPCNLDSYG